MKESSPPLVLASASPRRRALLAAAGYAFTVQVADVEEVTPPGAAPEEVVMGNARLKARAVAALRPDALVLGVDTVVAFAGEIFGKPPDEAGAFAMLSRLNGHSHEVFSGVCLLHGASGRERTWVETTRVHFHQRTDSELRAYLARIGPLDKAGAYAAQDDEGVMIARLEGSRSNVVGLPMEGLKREVGGWG